MQLSFKYIDILLIVGFLVKNAGLRNSERIGHVICIYFQAPSSYL